MKQLILSALIMASLSFNACNDNNANKIENSTGESAGKFSCPMHPDVIGTKGDKCSECGMELTEQVSDAHHNNTMHEMMDSNSHTMMHDSTMNDSTMNSTKNHMNTNLNKVESSIVVTQDKFSTDEIVKKYLSLKNALTKDDAKTSSSIAKNIINIITNMDINSVDVKKQKDYTVLVKNIKEHATHISDNAKDIEHQRTHFELLSNDFSSLIETFGSSQKLYQDFCPMYHEGKGAYWISEMKEIKNPYYGSQMLSCGSLKKEL